MIRQLDSSHAIEMARLHAQSFSSGWPEADMVEHCESDIVLGVGALDGFIIIRVSGDQAEILTILIDQKKRQRGLAGQLLSQGLAAAKDQGAEIIFLEVAEDNPAAIALYKTSGFEQFGKRPAYYRREGGRVAALTFRKKLDASQTTRYGNNMVSWIEKKCNEKGLRMTEQRRVIAKVLSNAEDHPDAEELYRRASDVDPKISLATVYRTVRLFSDAGIIETHDFRDGRARYETADADHHDHLIDVQTGAVIEFVDEEIEELQHRIAKKLGYELVDHRLELYGKKIS